jgi:hypothetical protein
MFRREVELKLFGQFPGFFKLKSLVEKTKPSGCRMREVHGEHLIAHFMQRDQAEILGLSAGLKSDSFVPCFDNNCGKVIRLLTQCPH